MFYDLNVPWAPLEAGMERTIAFLDELGYSVIALSRTLSGKLPPEVRCEIPDPLPISIPSKVRILRRCTLVHSDPSQNHRLPALASSYDIVAIRPTNEKSLQQACHSLECDLISLDLTTRLDFHFKMKMVGEAIERGIKFEICYSPGILAFESSARRNLISNATQLIRATRGRGLVISSEASRAVGCRGPWDVINLAAVWGLGQEKGKEAIHKLARSVVVSAQMRRTSYRGVVDIVYGGEKPGSSTNTSKAALQNGKKRKAGDLDTSPSSQVGNTKPLSKREQKRRAKKARLEANQDLVPDSTAAEESSKPESID